MSREISFQVHRLLDTDDTEGVPYIQIKPEEGVDWSADTKAHKSTGLGSRKKDETFEWDPEVTECVVNFTLDPEVPVEKFVAVVNVFFDQDGSISRYDGVGRIENLSIEGMEDAICTLYDNGNEDLPSFGDLVFSYQLVDKDMADNMSKTDNNVTTDESIQRKMDENNPKNWSEEYDDEHQRTYYYNHAMLYSTWDRPSCLDSSSIPTGPTSQTSSVPASSKFPFGSNTAEFSDPFAMQDTGSDLSATMRTGSNYQAQANQDNPANRSLESNGEENTACDGIRKKKLRKKTPEWAKIDQFSPQIDNMVKKSMSYLSVGDFNFSIRVHSVICSNADNSINPDVASTAQLKMSIQPFPGKASVIKSVLCDSNTDGILNFDFNLQSVSLSMSAADLKSKAFLNGVCPQVLVEFTCMGITTRGHIFLPGALSSDENQLTLINMLPLSGKNGDGSSLINVDTKLKSTLILEVIKTKSLNQKNENKSNQNPTMPPAAMLSIQVRGISALSKLKLDYDNCILEASLSCGGQCFRETLNSGKAFKEGLIINKSFNFTSDFPNLDILALKIFNNGSEPRLLGEVDVPIKMLTAEPFSAEDLNGNYKSFCIERPPSSKKGIVMNKVSINNWAIALSVNCSIDNESGRESPLSHFFGATPLTTLNETDECNAEGDFGPESPEKKRIQNNKRFETVNSVNGSLRVCVHGFIPKQGSTGPSLSKADMLQLEFTLPNAQQALREKTEMVRTGIYSDGTNESLCSLWDKEFSFPVVWALQQRHVGFLQGVLYRSSVNDKDKDKSTSSRQILGYISLDVASMVLLQSSPIVVSLPVTDHSCSDEDFHLCHGFVMLGLHFFDSSHPDFVANAKNDDSGIKLKTVERPPLASRAHAWEEGNAHHSPSRPLSRGANNRELSPLPLPATAFSDAKRACLDQWPLFCSAVIQNFSQQSEGGAPDNEDASAISISLSDIEITSYSLQCFGDDSNFSLSLGSNDSRVGASGSINAENTKISLEENDLTVPVVFQGNMSMLLTLKLATLEDEEVLGVSNLAVPRDIIVTGKPLNIAVPLRDKNGARIGIVYCGIHFSSMGKTPSIGDHVDDGPHLKVCVVEGSIIDSVWTSTLEPFFECTLQREVKAGPPIGNLECSRTSSVDVGASGNWNALCKVKIPEEALQEQTNKQASCLWSLSIVCRDAARLGSPELSRTQMNIPYSLLSNSQPMEQWINMMPASGGVSLLHDENDEDSQVSDGAHSSEDSFSGRIHIRVERVESGDGNKKNKCFPGVGHVMTWFHSIREGEAHNEKVYPPVDILAAEANVNCVNNQNQFDDDDDGAMNLDFNGVHIESRQSIFVANKIADVLSGSIAVPGGYSINHFRIAIRNEKIPLLASIPTLATLPKSLGESNLSLDVPIHDILIRPVKDKNFVGSIRQRVSRLKLGAVFVPYVEGVLHVEHSNLELFDTVSDRFQQSKSRHGALRYSLGGVGSCFTSPFSISLSSDDESLHSGSGKGSISVVSNLTRNTGCKQPSSGKKSSTFKRTGSAIKRSKGSKSTNKLRSMVAKNKQHESDPQLISVDTYELLTQAAAGKSSRADIFDLSVTLVDLDAVGKEYCMGTGQVKTAPIYYQALRMLLSQRVDNPIVPSSMATTIDIFDRNRSVIIGCVNITLKFDVTKIPSPFIRFMKEFKNELYACPASGEDGGLRRAELGLKQAYQIADKDKSGGINMNELTEVLQTISIARKKKDRKNIVGFDEGAMTLLVGLMGLVNGTRSHGEVDYSRDEILKLFQTMDLDGDGNVSWWEWKQVLEGGFATMLMQSVDQSELQKLRQRDCDCQVPQEIYPLDPLLVCLEAVNALLLSRYGGVARKSTEMVKQKKDYIDVQISSSDKLREKIAKIQEKNHRLKAKLEAARQSAADVVDPPQNEGADDSKNRSRKLDEQSKQVRDLLEKERKRRTELEKELEMMQHASRESLKSRSILNSSSQQSLAQLHEQSEQLRKEMIIAKLFKKQKNRSAQVLQNFFFKVRQKSIARKEEEEKRKLGSAMENLLLRKRYKNKKSHRSGQAVKIQSCWRRYAAKKRVLLIWKSVFKIQELALLRKLRRAAGDERNMLLQQLFLQRTAEAAKERQLHKSASVIQNCFRSKKERDRIRAATRLQAAIRGHLSRRHLHGELDSELSDGKPLDDLSISKDEVLEDTSVFLKLHSARSLDDGDEDVMILWSVPRPPVDRVVGYWVCHPPPETHTIDDEREARVEEIDVDTLEMRVEYAMEDPPDEAFFQYDDPSLTWLKECSKAEIRREKKAATRIQAIFRSKRDRDKVKTIRKDVDNKRKNAAASKIQARYRGGRAREQVAQQRANAYNKEEHSMASDGLLICDAPPLERAPGHWVRLEEGDQEGLVDRVDKQSGVMTVMYDIDEDGDGVADSTDERQIDYSQPGLIWLKECDGASENDSTVSDDLVFCEAPPLERAPGHWVRLEEGDQEGLVDRVDKQSGVMTVMYDIDEDGDGVADSTDERQIDYSQPGLIWMKDSHHNDQSSVISEDILYKSISKPSISKAPGYWIKIGEETEEGLVDKVLKDSNKLVVLFDDDTKQDGVAVVEVDYDRPDIVWMEAE